jgi:hypothetical protein
MDKLQRAGRDFLMRLVAKHGLAGSARASGRRQPPAAKSQEYLSVETLGDPHYDELDRRLMDTFPASDAVARY